MEIAFEENCVVKVLILLISISLILKARNLVVNCSIKEKLKL